MKIDNILSFQNFSKERPVKTDILKSKKFNIVLVCFDEAQEITPHPEPYAVFFLVLQGKGLFTKGDDSFEIEKGGGIFIKKDEPRGIKALEKLTVLGVQDGH